MSFSAYQRLSAPSVGRAIAASTAFVPQLPEPRRERHDGGPMDNKSQTKDEILDQVLQACLVPPADQLPPPQPIRPSDKTDLRRLLEALCVFQEIRDTMPLQYVLMLLEIALKEGLSVGEYSDLRGVSFSVGSRHILDLGPRNRYGDGQGFGLIKQGVNAADTRAKAIWLTPKGRGVLADMLAALRGAKRKSRKIRRGAIPERADQVVATQPRRAAIRRGRLRAPFGLSRGQSSSA